MNLQIKDKLFIVGGATSGLGRAVAEALISEGAIVIAVARRKELLTELADAHPGQVEGVIGDITLSETIHRIVAQIGQRRLDGMLVNAGGPPAKSFLETTIEEWDQSYQNVMRWKIEMTKALLPKLMAQGYGRLLYVESMSVKQPIENLVLSNSFRLGVVGFVKTLSQEIAEKGITLNIMAPGFHETAAMTRLFKKKSDLTGMSVEEARKTYETQVKVGRMGEPAEFASLAAWLMSPVSGFITGQTISLDGGSIVGTMG